MRMVRASVVLGMALLAPAVPAPAADHLAPAAAVDQALAGAEGARRADLARLQALLASPVARSAAERAGVDLAQVRGALPSLSDAELRDLAARAARLDADPVAGRIVSHDVDQLLVIFLIVAIVILVLKAV